MISIPCLSARYKFEKMKELITACIHFGADEDGKIPKTKLAKLVYLSDFLYFYNNLEAITQLEYKKYARGPVADEYFSCLDDLLNDEVLKFDIAGRSHLYSFLEHIPFQNGTILSDIEVETVKIVCNKWKTKTTKEIVDFTHNQVPWSISFDMDIIPYSLITQEDPTNVF